MSAMSGRSAGFLRWAIVVVFAVAMAWVEAASVFYVRALVDRIEPYQPDPLPMTGALGPVELWREAATLVMIAAVGLLAGRTWPRRAGYAALAFGVWDIFYYVFLRMMSGWPATVFDWDILFLLPLPWWGPVLAPICIALLMIVWGTLITQRHPAASTPGVRETWALAAFGIVLALIVFMADTGRAAQNGAAAVLQVLPAGFNWPLFIAALMLMASPVLHQLFAWPARHRRIRSDSAGGRGLRATAHERRQVLAGEGRFRRHQIGGRALEHDPAAVVTRARAEIDDPVGVRHHRLVVLDHDDGLAGVNQAVEQAE
jgi:hypothetical protein